MTIAERPVGSKLLAKCQRPSCDNAARLTKTGKPTKYCSDNCRMRVADDAYKARQAAEPDDGKVLIAGVEYEAETLQEAEPARETPVIKARHRIAHKGQPRWLAQATVNGKTIYGYAKTEAEARAKVQARLG